MLPPNHLELPFMTPQTDCDSPAERIQNHPGINARTHKNTHSEPSVCERVNAHRHWRQSSGVSAHLHRPWLVPLPEEDFCRESETQRRGLPFFRLWPSCCGAGWKALARMCPWLFSPSLSVCFPLSLRLPNELERSCTSRGRPVSITVTTSSSQRLLCILRSYPLHVLRKF